MKDFLTPDTPMVSVAMISYNREDAVERAIRGVLGQRTPFAFELVIVDDASTDRTYEIARRWAERYPSVIRLYRNPQNIGLQRNYVEAFSRCRGRYLALCDFDDWWISPSKLARQVAYMEQHPDCAITFHRVVNYYEADRTMSLSAPGIKVDSTIADLARSNYITNLSVVYRRGLVDLTDLPEWIFDDVSPDYAIHLLYARHGYIHYFSRPMGVYRISASGTWSVAARYRQLDMSLRVREHLVALFSDCPEAVGPLRQAIVDILIAMLAVCPSADKDCIRRKIRSYGIVADIDVDRRVSALRAATGRKPLISRIRAALSRLMPLPGPPPVAVGH